MGFWHIYSGIYGGGVVAAVVATNRSVCVGTSLARSILIGTSTVRSNITGTSTVQTEMIGTDP